MEQHRYFKIQILGPLITGLSLLLLTFFTVLYLFQKHSIHENFEKHVTTVDKIFHNHLEEDARLMGSMIYLIQKDPLLQQLWIAQDRNKLYDQTKEVFQDLRSKWNITHFYFIGLDGKCFLRVHNPTRYGDDIKRHTFKSASTTKRPSSGIELGTFATFALRVVYPWKVDGKLVGYIELGEEIEHVPSVLKDSTEIDTILLINKKFINKKKWAVGQKMLNRNDLWDQFANYIIISNTISIPNLKLQKDYGHDHKHDPDHERVYNGENYYQSHVPLKDAAGDNVGRMVMLQNTTLQTNTFKRYTLIVVLSFLGLGGVLFIIFFFLIRIVENDLKNTQLEHSKIQSQLFQSTKLASIGELASGVGHEINNPLTIAIGNISMTSKLLQKEGISHPKLINNIENIATAHERIRVIVDGLRIYSRSDSNQQKVICVNKAIDQTISLISAIYKQDGITIICNQHAIELFILGTVGKLQQVIMNLISNAKDATEGQQARIITITLSENSKKMVILTISDNGKGIEDTVKDKIFNPFFTTKKIGKGTGLGLGLTHELVLKMDGQVGFTSEINKGTTFSITIPSTEQQVTEVLPERHDTNLKLKGSILIVDDESEIRDIIIHYLKDYGLEVDEAHDGISALEKIRNKEYQYICTDIKMPNMAGDELIREAKKITTGTPKFIVISGGISTDQNHDIEKIKASADEFLTKPFSKESLYQALVSKTRKS